MTFKLKQRDVKKSEEIKKAFKVDGNGNPLNFHWKEDQAQEFIDFVVDESGGLLNKFRVVPMTGPTKEIAKIIDDGSFLKPGWSYKRTWSSTWDDAYEFWTDKIQLVSKKIEWKIYFSDDEIQDNIEGETFETHAKKIVAKKISNEIIEAAIYSRALQNPSAKNGILNMFNWIKFQIQENWHRLKADDSNIFASREISRSTFIKAKKTIKTKYRKEIQAFLDSDLKTDLDELYNSPNNFNAEIIKNSISWIPLNEVPLMRSDLPVINASVSTTVNTAWASAWQKIIPVTSDKTANISVWDTIVVNYGLASEMSYTVAAITSTTITTEENLVYALVSTNTIHKATTDGADVIMTNPKNIVVWIQLDIETEGERLAPDWWNVWYKMRMDILMENTDAAVLVENLKSKN